MTPRDTAQGDGRIDGSRALGDLAALSGLAPQLARTFVTVASDIALVLDANGVIRDVALGGAEPLEPLARDWIGRAWADTVTGETRKKIEQMLHDVATSGVSRQRQVNHPSRAADIPISYAAVRLGADGPVLAVGRDLRAVAAIQQRFVETQQEMERNYWQKRQAESRYRLLFHVATDAVFVVDAQSMRVLDANRACLQLFDLAYEHLVEREATVGFDRASRPAVDELLHAARATGQPAEIHARLGARRLSTRVSATPFRSEDKMLLLVRARAVADHEELSETGARLMGLVERSPDALVVTDTAGRILAANPAFVELAQLAGEAEAKGRTLDHWVGRPAGDGSHASELAALLSTTQQHGLTTSATMSVRGARGSAETVELSAVLLPEGDQDNIGITMRRIARDDTRAVDSSALLAAAIEQIALQLGRLDLAQLVREVTDRAESHFLLTALHRAGGDRARAAEALGISERGLALKLRHHQLDPSGASDGASGGASDRSRDGKGSADGADAAGNNAG